jgi:hypothetical protein
LRAAGPVDESRARPQPFCWDRCGHRYKEDVVGFVLAWATVGGIVALAWGILQFGKP